MFDKVGNLELKIKDRLRLFYKTVDLSELYKSYGWLSDTWERGFPNIFDIENKILQNEQKNTITETQIFDVAKWGRLRSRNRINCAKAVLDIPVFDSCGQLINELLENPSLALMELDEQTSGLGSTYLSKVLRFMAPNEYGAIDTRIVRIFGKAAPEPNLSWLPLRVNAAGKEGFYIPKDQAFWKGYAKWINILRFLTNLANDSDAGIFCPHPQRFVKNNLRVFGSWGCADIEMALFAYATQKLRH